MTYIKRIICAILLFSLILCVFPFATFAYNAQQRVSQRVVRVAYPLQMYLTEMDENGNYSGYSAEYLKKVAEFANWKLEYVTYPGKTLNEQILEGMRMVESGEADLIGVMLKNDELQKKYLYPENNYGVVYTTLEVLENNLQVTEVNYMSKNPLRVAVLRQASTRNAELAAFAESAKMHYEYIYCDSVAEQIKTLQNGTADAILKVSLSFIPGLKPIAQFSPRPYYFISGHGNEALLEEMDKAIHKINLTDPYFQNRLRAKYFEKTISNFVLTDKEIQFVNRHTVVQVLVLPQYAPFSFLSRNGELGGIGISILNEIGRKVGLDFEYHILNKNKTAKEEIATGNYDMVVGPPHSNAFAESNQLVLSQPYLETNFTMFINEDAESKPKAERTLAAIGGVTDLIQYNYKEMRLYDSFQECLEAVNMGEADYGYGNKYAIDFYTSPNSHVNLHYVDLPGFNREIGFFVPSDGDVELLSILNKYVRSIPTEDVHEYLVQALHQKQYAGIDGLMQNDPMLMAAAAIVFLLLLMLVVMLVLYSHANIKRNQKLESAFAAKSEFLSRMSHDMRTPMNGIIGLTELTLDAEKLPAEAKQNLLKIDESAKYLLSLINDTLDMNKIENNKIVLHTEPTDVREFYKKIVPIAQISADQKNVKLIVHKSDNELPLLHIDKLRMQQIFFNLVSNAIKFTPEGGSVEITGQIAPCNETQMMGTFTVKDTGIGIDEAFLPKIFEPFEQEHDTTIGNYAGSGLGLAIVKNLVETMQGSITVQSVKGAGAEFTVSIPFEIAHKQHVCANAKNKENTMLQGKRILLCEDHPLNAQIATKLLEKKGILVETAQNGKVAAEMFEKSECGYFDAILMDIRMPVMDGIAATSRIRGMKRADAKSVPIIAMTANAFDEDMHKSTAAGMNAHLAKPIDTTLLFDTLYELTQNNCK